MRYIGRCKHVSRQLQLIAILCNTNMACFMVSLNIFLVPQENLNLPHGETCTTDVTVPEVLLCHTDLVCDECLAGDGLACQIPVKGK